MKPQTTLPLDHDLAVHIFTASAAMVGVCLTVIGLFRISDTLRTVGTIGDDLMAIDAGVFLTSCLLAYLALRTRATPRRSLEETLADWIFLIGLCLMAVVCGLIAYELV